MATALPPATDFTGASVTEGQFKTAITNLRSHIAEQSGTEGTRPTARNRVINGNFQVNQDAVSGTVTLAAGAYGHDMWKAGAGGCTYTFSTVQNVTTLTISAGSLVQAIEGLNLETGTYTLSWAGTAQGKIGAGAYAASGVTGSVTGGSNLSVEFSTGTVSKVQFESGSTATPFVFLSYGQELILCQRYFYKSYSRTVAPNAAAGATGGFFTALNASYAYGSNIFPVEMRTVPTIALYNPNGGSGAGTAYNLSTGLAVGATAADVTDKYLNSIAVTSTAGNLIVAHFTASARL